MSKQPKLQLVWWDKDQIEHGTVLDHVEITRDGTVEGYRDQVVSVPNSQYLSHIVRKGVIQLKPTDYFGRVLVREAQQ